MEHTHTHVVPRGKCNNRNFASINCQWKLGDRVCAIQIWFRLSTYVWLDWGGGTMLCVLCFSNEDLIQMYLCVPITLQKPNRRMHAFYVFMVCLMDRFFFVCVVFFLWELRSRTFRERDKNKRIDPLQRVLCAFSFIISHLSCIYRVQKIQFGYNWLIFVIILPIPWK